MSATSGINAIAHAVEGLYAPDATPIISLMAEEGIRALAAALPRVVADGTDLEARGRGPVRRLAVRRGAGRHDDVAAPQALPRPRRHPRPAARPDAHRRPAARAGLQPARRARRRSPRCPARSAGLPDPARELWELAGRLGAPRSLRELGMAEADIPRIAEQAVASPYANPRPVTRDGVESLLRAAWAGEAPAALMTPGGRVTGPP